ncbi:hypothetical protein QE152_g23483 [Popillia japonica]|uniref:Uncharacterized protein n=1 Tax=Popillia japonica TaxID=7064 RepID=A0AAW1KHE9_POPJA
MVVEAFIRSVMIVDTKVGEFLLNRDVENLTLEGAINLARNKSDWFTHFGRFKDTNKSNASANKNFRDTNFTIVTMHGTTYSRIAITPALASFKSNVNGFRWNVAKFSEKFQCLIGSTMLKLNAQIDYKNNMIHFPTAEILRGDRKEIKLKNIEIRQKYYEETGKRLRRKWKEVQHQGLEELWKSFKNILSETAKEICGTKSVDTTKKSSRWWNNKVRTKVKEKKNAWKKYIKTGKKEDKKTHNLKRNEAKQEVLHAKKCYWEDFGREIEKEYQTNKGKFWKTIKNINSGKMKKQIWIIEDSNNEIKTEAEEVLEVWRKFYEEKFMNNSGHSAYENNTGYDK